MRRVLRERTPWRSEEVQRHDCKRALEKFLSQQQEVSKVTPKEDASTTAAPRLRPRRTQQDEDADKRVEPINKSTEKNPESLTTDKKRVNLKTRHERTAKGPSN